MNNGNAKLSVVAGMNPDVEQLFFRSGQAIAATRSLVNSAKSTANQTGHIVLRHDCMAAETAINALSDALRPFTSKGKVAVLVKAGSTVGGTKYNRDTRLKVAPDWADQMIAHGVAEPAALRTGRSLREVLRDVPYADLHAEIKTRQRFWWWKLEWPVFAAGTGVFVVGYFAGAILN